MLEIRLDQRFGRHLDTQIDHLIAVVGENDLHQVFADIMHVALHGRQNDLAARRACALPAALLHELLQMIHRGLHGLRRLQHFRHDQLVVIEQPPYFAHAHHQRSVDDVERRRAFSQLQFQSRDQAVLGPFDDVVGQPLVERQIARQFFGPASGLPEMAGDARRCGID